ncbi:trichohyalin-like [Haliotis asinina]|uniref:trichohyalin-like n=1 Tax=Haliotis asinina TaxID=109174 RepID=UPI003531F309
MVLTDLPFERSPVIYSRYSLLRRPDSAPPGNADDGDTTTENKRYAAFLKEQERKVGPDGFVDSSRYGHPYVLRNDPLRKRAQSNSDRPNVVNLTSRVERDKKDYEKRIRIIEDHMWQHKQEERELKRVEGDIIKNQRSVRHTLRDFENAINKKRLAEDKKLNHALEKLTKISQDHTHKKEERTKKRIGLSLSRDQGAKQVDRKVFVKQNVIAREYQTKLSELELKRVELSRFSQEFETKLREKEVEQYKLKQELAELAITLNMEAQKRRVQRVDTSREAKADTTKRIHENNYADLSLESKLMRSDGDGKTAELQKRKLSADLSLTKAHLDIKKRDEQRHLTDTQIRLEDNTTIQRSLNTAAVNADLDLKARQIEQRLEAHNTRRVTQLHNSMRQKKDKEESQQAVWEARFKRRQAEQQRREHEDSLKFFQKMVVKGEDTEQNLYQKVRNAEYARQKQEQTVRRIHNDLQETKRINAIKLKKEIAERHQQEQELEHKLIREKAELDKTHAQREESYMKLQNHRQQLKEDKYLLKEHEKEHLRLIRIGAKTDMANSDLY